MENMPLVDELKSMDDNNNKREVIPRLDNMKETSREQVSPHDDNKTRVQRATADDTADTRDSDVDAGLEFDNKGEVPTVQMAPHGKARGQWSAAVVTADTSDRNDDHDLEPYVGPADQNAAARPAGSEADRDAQGDSHVNEDPQTSNMEATNGSEAVQDSINRISSSNEECESPGSI